MEIRPAENADTDAIVELARAADDVRVVSAESLRHQRRSAPRRMRLLELVMDDDGEVVGAGAAGLDTSAGEGTGWATVTTAPHRRGEGIGSALGEALLDHLRGLGVGTVTSFTRYSEEGERWATKRGWKRALAGPLIAVDPRLVPEPVLPTGFRCVTLNQITPDDAYEAIREAAFDEPNAVPRTDFAFEELVRTWQNPDIDLRSSAAVVEGDRVVAFSFMKVGGDRGQHGFSGTARDYRGRGLATAAKCHALRAAAARGVVRVTTSNAEENVAIRAINRKLGFEPIGEHVILAREL
jgi:ribosomal protein S18 acetylase RimI-like enzyme